MVVTDLPFSRPEGMASRYNLLKGTKSSAGKEGDSQQYAAFLKEKERKCGPDGFVDSTRFKHSFEVRQSHSRRDGKTLSPNRYTVVDLSTRKDKDQQDYEHRLKVIEDHMWQHKQEERELKRVEGDIIKNQRAVRRTLRDYENAITRKRLAETKKMNQGLEKYTVLQHQHVHTKAEQTKSRIESNDQTDTAHKDVGRKVQLTTSDLARQYRSKMSEMDLKRTELKRLSVDFEVQLRTKEEEQFRLKQELADLAISLNMEAQKGRQLEADYQKDTRKLKTKRLTDDMKQDTTLENKLAKSDGDTKAAEVGRRKLSADLSLTRAHLSLKQREGGRHLQDTENRLRTNITEQKSLNDAAHHAEMDLKSRMVDQKMQEHETRRRVLAVQSHKQRREKSANHEVHFSAKAQKRNIDQQRREHEDGLKFFQKMVIKGEDKEHQLYNKVRNAEYARQKQEQAVKRLSSKLTDAKKDHAIKIKNEMAELSKAEGELEQKLIREQALLAKVHSEREESYIALQKHREMLREDKYLLDEHDREHARLMRIGVKSEGIITQA